MQPRMDFQKISPGALKAMRALDAYIQQSHLEPSLLELVRVRASQINGCAYCIDMHTKDARAAGETEQRLYALNSWEGAPFYTDRERAALSWTESVTLVSSSHVPDETYKQVRRHFSEKDLVDLTMAVIAINGWNRLAISFRALAGAYQPAAARKPRGKE